MANSFRSIRLFIKPGNLEPLLVASIFLAALLLRLFDLRGAPPGAQHDEVFSANFASQILNGARPVYFDQNGGVMAFYAYLVAPVFAVFGADILALRLVSVACGLATVVFVYLLARRLFGVTVALIAAALIGVSHWHLFESRVGLEPISLMMMASATAWLFARLYLPTADAPPPSTLPVSPSTRLPVSLFPCLPVSLSTYLPAIRTIGLGVALGLTTYTYHSSPLVFLALIVWVVYLFIWHRQRFQMAWQSLALAFATALLVLAPLAVHVLTTEGDATSRTEDLSADLRAALNGDVEPLARNVLGVLGMLAFAGDPSWRYNLAGRPVFTPLVGLLAYAGFALCVRRWRDPRYAFVVIWVLCNVVASAITRASPSFLRSTAALPLIVFLPAIALSGIYTVIPGARRLGRLGARRLWRVAALVALGGLLAWETASTLDDYFVRWANAERVRTTYRADLAEIASFLDAQRPAGAVMLSARYASDLDQDALYLLQRRKQRYQWFNGRRVLILPDERTGQGVSYFIPATNESLGDGAELLRTLEARAGPLDEQGKPFFTLYYLPAGDLQRLRARAPQFSLRANAANEVELIGADAHTSGRNLHLLLYWRVLLRVPGDRNRSFFAHLLTEDGRRLAQEDRSAYPTSSWQDGDVVWQWYGLVLPPDAPAGNYYVDFGVYDANAPGQPRLNILDARGNVVDNRVRVGPLAFR